MRPNVINIHHTFVVVVVVVLNYETLTVEMAQKRCYTKCFSRPIKVKDVRCAVC